MIRTILMLCVVAFSADANAGNWLCSAFGNSIMERSVCRYAEGQHGPESASTYRTSAYVQPTSSGCTATAQCTTVYDSIFCHGTNSCTAVFNRFGSTGKGAVYCDNGLSINCP